MKNRSSTTAEGMALVRAIEASRPADQRICYDPLARSLVNNISVKLSKLFIDSGIYARLYTPGTIEFIVARERYIDDYLVARLQEGLDQVVILGAGFDTRAYRIPGIAQTDVFEVDHPATQRVKLAKLTKAIGPLPERVTFIPTDFTTQTLGDVLPAAGYDEDGRTLFIWQGVTMYLTPTAVDDTLAFIARHSGPGSAVIFDYFTSEFLRDENNPAVRRLRSTMRAIGEEHVFGIGAGQVGHFLTARGFQEVQDADAEELRRRYFTNRNAGRPIAAGAAIASARVGSTDGQEKTGIAD